MRLFALLAAGLFAGSLFAEDKKPKDEEAILGTWKVEKMDDGTGKEPPAEEIAKMRVTFKKEGKMVSKQSFGGESDAEYKLDSAAKPKTIDITESARLTPGVYELDGDTLKLCVSQGKTRPTEFKADGKGVVVMTLKRVKDEKK